MQVQKIIREIERMEYDDLMQVLDAAILRWRGMFPGWEIFSVSVPQDDREALQRSTDMIIRLMDEGASKTNTHVAPKGDPDPTTAAKNKSAF